MVKEVYYLWTTFIRWNVTFQGHSKAIASNTNSTGSRNIGSMKTAPKTLLEPLQTYRLLLIARAC